MLSSFDQQVSLRVFLCYHLFFVGQQVSLRSLRNQQVSVCYASVISRWLSVFFYMIIRYLFVILVWSAGVSVVFDVINRYLCAILM